MEYKDNRSKSKIKKVYDHRHRKPNRHQESTGSTGSIERVRGVVDVADSSDEFLIGRQHNWNRLNSLDVQTDDTAVAGNDFTLLANMATNGTGHFVLSSEKEWLEAADIEDIDSQWSAITNKFFSFNAKQVNNALQTVAFHKLMDYPSSMFTHDEIVQMNKNAEEAELEYQKLFANLSKVPQGDVMDGTTSASNAVEPLNVTVDAPKVNKADEDWLDSVLAE